jgi:hypothetical protein
MTVAESLDLAVDPFHGLRARAMKPVRQKFFPGLLLNVVPAGP